jgi:tetratricopeptide (TPR) repeat protein
VDDGDPAHFDEALDAYRRTLEIDPYLVPALINLANIHYARSQMAEAQALYERAIALEPDVFESHFNLGNIFTTWVAIPKRRSVIATRSASIRRTRTRTSTWRVTREERHVAGARLHWKAYQELAPNGEWVHLAREFSD